MKERITVTIDKKLLKEIDDGVDSYRFANRSHAFEFIIAKEKQNE